MFSLANAATHISVDGVRSVQEMMLNGIVHFSLENMNTQIYGREVHLNTESESEMEQKTIGIAKEQPNKHKLPENYSNWNVCSVGNCVRYAKAATTVAMASFAELLESRQ